MGAFDEHEGHDPRLEEEVLAKPEPKPKAESKKEPEPAPEPKSAAAAVSDKKS